MHTQSHPTSKPSVSVNGTVPTIHDAYYARMFARAGREEAYSNRTKAQVIYELKDKYDVLALVKVAGMARSTYYYWERRLDRPDKYAVVKQHILEVAGEYHGPYAYRRVTEALIKRGIRHDPKTIKGLMKELGL